MSTIPYCPTTPLAQSPLSALPDVVPILLRACSAMPPLPALVPEILIRHGVPLLVLRCRVDHPETPCRGHVLWVIVPGITVTGVPVFLLHHRNRRPPRGWHLHALALGTYAGVQRLLGFVGSHDDKLYFAMEKENVHARISA